MNDKIETRPRINADKSDIIELRHFADEFEISRDEVYGYAIELLANRSRSENQESLANEITEDN